MKSTISSRGQITIPVKLQRALGMGPGTPVEFVLQEGAALLRKRQEGPRAVDRYYGILKGLPPTDVQMRELRGPSLYEELAQRRRSRKR